jgi:hypothetical protein
LLTKGCLVAILNRRQVGFASIVHHDVDTLEALDSGCHCIPCLDRTHDIQPDREDTVTPAFQKVIQVVRRSCCRHDLVAFSEGCFGNFLPLGSVNS